MACPHCRVKRSPAIFATCRCRVRGARGTLLPSPDQGLTSSLSRVHPKDAWGPAFAQREFAALYDGETLPEGKRKRTAKQPLRALLASTQSSVRNARPAPGAFNSWTQARRAFLRRFIKPRMEW